MAKSTPAHVWYVTIDCRDPDELAAFWSKLLGLEIKGHFGSSDYLTMLARPGDDAVALAFQRVPEPKTVKNRMHLDVHPPLELGLPGLVARLEALGGTRVGEPVTGLLESIGVWWQVMVDPEGNELCVVAEPGHPPPA